MWVRLFRIKLFLIVLLISACATQPAPPSAIDAGEYGIVVDGFNANDMDALEDKLERFPEYRSLRLKTNVDHGARYREYWYKTDLTNLGLQRGIRRALKDLNLRGLVEATDNVISVTYVGRN